jgi:hypothetical protein
MTCAPLGATDKQLAVVLKVSVRTIDNWKQRHPEFGDALTLGKLICDANVAKGLRKRAMGYTFEDTDIRTVGVGKGESVIVKTPVVREMHPDPVAAQYWLNNRQPDKWKAKTEVAVEHVNLDLETATSRFVNKMREAHERQEAIRAERRAKGMTGD